MPYDLQFLFYGLLFSILLYKYFLFNNTFKNDTGINMPKKEAKLLSSMFLYVMKNDNEQKYRKY